MCGIKLIQKHLCILKAGLPLHDQWSTDACLQCATNAHFNDGNLWLSFSCISATATSIRAECMSGCLMTAALSK